MTVLDRVRAAEAEVRAATRPLPDSPLTIAYGMGVDSTAMLIGLRDRGLRPDLILFADTGGEKPGTYAYRSVIEAWLKRSGFPELHVVRYLPTARVTYMNLEGECLANGTLPTLAFGRKGCSLKWKKDPQDRFKARWQPAIDAWKAGRKVVTAIGLDNGAKDSRRACKYWGAVKEDPKYHTWHPLREWGWDREHCEAVIIAAGLPLPPKSACFFCPASQREEILKLEPELLDRALAIEDGARAGKHKIGTGSVKGLGRKWTWRDLVEANA